MTEHPVIILCERLTIDEEANFLIMVNDAEASGEITAEEAADMIDREFELLASMAK